jgi:hypothetical protein
MKQSDMLYEDDRTPGERKRAKLTRNTETTIDDAPQASPDERGRQYQANFETVYDASERITPMVPTEFNKGAPGYRIEPANSTFHVDQYNQNALPGVMEDDVAEGSIKELELADTDYPGGHPTRQATSGGYDLDETPTVDRHDYFRSRK